MASRSKHKGKFSDSAAPVQKKARQSSSKARRIVPTLISRKKTKKSKLSSAISPVLHRNTVRRPRNLSPTCIKPLFKDRPTVSTGHRLTAKDLHVRRSVQTPAKMFAEAGKPLGQGVFTRRTHGGWTVDIYLQGRGVSHIHHTEMSGWQKDYAIMDLYNDGYVFVPPTHDNMHIIFRVQHSPDPSHQLVQETDGPPCFICLREIDGGEEITMDYCLFTHADDDEEPEESPDPSDMEASFSLTQTSEVSGSGVAGSGVARLVYHTLNTHTHTTSGC